MLFTRRGFTLIELLVVISIIALLSAVAMTSVQGQRNRAKDVSFQSTANSIQNAVGACCVGGGATINTVLGADLCSPVSGSLYPFASSLGSVIVLRDCNDVQGFNIKLTPGVSNDGAIDYAVCDRDGCEFVY